MINFKFCFDDHTSNASTFTSAQHRQEMYSRFTSSIKEVMLKNQKYSKTICFYHHQHMNSPSTWKFNFSPYPLSAAGSSRNPTLVPLEPCCESILQVCALSDLAVSTLFATKDERCASSILSKKKVLHHQGSRDALQHRAVLHTWLLSREWSQKRYRSRVMM